MKKLMLILLVAGNCYAEHAYVLPDDFYKYRGDSNAARQAAQLSQIQKNNAITDYVNRQASQYNFQVYQGPPVPFVAPNFNQPPVVVYPNPYPMGIYGNQQRPW